ncbi:uncharacterized protein [Rutidosis leptorrhynchoides]|uniref:uncharacterized protein n=1 Tax=Rutidosis leptorrhynchoides TaxID=125765 RepID=UPI003A9A1227
MALQAQQLGTKRKAGAGESLEATEISFPTIQALNTSCAPIVLPTPIRQTNKPPTTALSGFSGESAWPIGILDLRLELRDSKDKLKKRTESVEFCVVRSYSRYNAILGSSIQNFGAIPSTIHGMVRFPTERGVATLESTPLDALCASFTDKMNTAPEEKGVNEWWVIVNPGYLEQKVKIGENLTQGTKEKLRNTLISNLDVFCWRDADMTRVPQEIAKHYLRAITNLTPIKQKKRLMAPDRSEWMRREVDKLVKANILSKVNYQTWVANPVLVAKSDGTWLFVSILKILTKLTPKTINRY